MVSIISINNSKLDKAVAEVTRGKNHLLPYKLRTQSQLQRVKHIQKSMAFHHELYQARYPALAFSVVSVLEHNMLFLCYHSLLYKVYYIIGAPGQNLGTSRNCYILETWRRE